jgi:tRNA pseudouridine synthase 9
LAEGKKSKSSNRKEDDFREVDDMHTAVYYFENGKLAFCFWEKKKILICQFLELRKVKPYYFEYKSFAKGRWLDRTLLEVFASEFRDRNEDYYVRQIIQKCYFLIHTCVEICY